MDNQVLNALLLAGANGFTGDTGAIGQTGVTGRWTPQPSHCARSSRMPWRCVISSSDRWLCQCVPSLAGASGFTGVTGATGQTGVTGGWTPQASHCARSSRMPWRCVISSSDRWLCQCVSSLAGASGFTGVTGATGQTGVTGGWTPQPAHCASSKHMPWRCLISTSDGQLSS